MAGWERYKVGRCLGGRMVRWLDGCAGVWARDGMRMGTMRERDRGREEMRGKASGKGSSWPTRTTEAHPTVRGERVSLLWCLRTDQSQGFLGDTRIWQLSFLQELSPGRPPLSTYWRAGLRFCLSPPLFLPLPTSPPLPPPPSTHSRLLLARRSLELSSATSCFDLLCSWT